MFIYTNQIALKTRLQTFLNKKKKIGFVPTMGALHQGHLSLMAKSLQQNRITVVSIFVNPTQFNNKEDLEKYPRDLKADVEKIKKLSQKIIIYSPSAEDIYGKNIVSEAFDYEGLENRMEGAFRPGHFDGVGTIVKKLFEIVQPTRAYFGEKDYQQTLIVKKMVEKLNLPVKIVVCPILREENGLAMSSRNERLSQEEREQAGLIYKTLLKTKTMFETRSHRKIYAYVERTFKKQKMMELEYFVIADSKTLKPIIKRFKSKEYRAFIAVNIGKVRLIDTISLK
ncbi:MAG: pantoate--beta-alanine ligase [Flavobacteriaceae bacterium]